MLALIKAILDLGTGYRTYLAALGLLGLSVYQLSEGQVQPAIQSFLAALAAFGIRQAVSNL